MSNILHENSKSKKGHSFVKKNRGLPPLLVWVPLLIVNNYSEFQVNIFYNYRDIRKCQSFRMTPDDDTADNDARAMTLRNRSLYNLDLLVKTEYMILIRTTT